MSLVRCLLSVVCCPSVNDQHGIAIGAKHVVTFECFLVGIHHNIVATKSGDEHEHGGEWLLEVHDKGIGYSEVVGREDEFVGPSLKFLDESAGTYCCFKGTESGGAYSTDLMAVLFCLVDDVASFCGSCPILHAW